MGWLKRAVKKVGSVAKKAVRKSANVMGRVATVGASKKYEKSNLAAAAKSKQVAANKAAADAAAKSKADELAKEKAAREELLGSKRQVAKAEMGQRGRAPNFEGMLSRFKSFEEMPDFVKNKLERGIVGRTQIQSNKEMSSLLRRGVSNPYALDRNTAKERTVSAYDPRHAIAKQSAPVNPSSSRRSAPRATAMRAAGTAVRSVMDRVRGRRSGKTRFFGRTIKTGSKRVGGLLGRLTKKLVTSRVSSKKIPSRKYSSLFRRIKRTS